MGNNGFSIIMFVMLVTLLTASIPNVFGQSSGQTLQQEISASTADPSAALDSTSPTTRKLVVQWQNDRLTVMAHHVTLQSVLASIAQRTGLVVEARGGVDQGLVYLDLGPGTMHDVLVALLDGDSNNYILTGSAQRPGFVEGLVLSRAGSTRIVATNQVPALSPQPQLYGGGFNAESNPLSNEPAVEAHETPVNTALPPVQSTIDTTIKGYQQAYAEMMKSGKSHAEILNELQQQQIRDLDAQAPAQPPQ